MYRVIARTRLADTTSDILRDFPTRQEADTFITSLGFSRYEDSGEISYWHLAVKAMKHGKEEDVNLSGYVVRV